MKNKICICFIVFYMLITMNSMAEEKLVPIRALEILVCDQTFETPVAIDSASIGKMYSKKILLGDVPLIMLNIKFRAVMEKERVLLGGGDVKEEIGRLLYFVKVVLEDSTKREFIVSSYGDRAFINNKECLIGSDLGRLFLYISEIAEPEQPSTAVMRYRSRQKEGQTEGVRS